MTANIIARNPMYPADPTAAVTAWQGCCPHCQQEIKSFGHKLTVPQIRECPHCGGSLDSVAEPNPYRPTIIVRGITGNRWHGEYYPN